MRNHQNIFPVCSSLYYQSPINTRVHTEFAVHTILANVMYIYIYKVVISIFLSVCLIVRSVLRNPWSDLPKILIAELGRPTEMNSLVLRF